MPSLASDLTVPLPTPACSRVEFDRQHFLGGLITTLTFTTMMHCTQRAEERMQATHYSFLATLEVLGKLCFSALAGWVVDWAGFQASFLLFLFLSAAATLHVWNATEIGGQRK
ncbi:hypothetical protein SKAU_G00275740 [Synaphobranchus kaupii]|uniref:Uncharacterized protein n=1 Tax=Synaphobranchus kaupii TaxID=118154 RepID=A0A9Q1F171_SYNKA|nr:hypothetical protein SKAU_G00275740 [Synaphobranchus kaupii]